MNKDMFKRVTEDNIEVAARVHAASWKESHRAFCSSEFVESHTTERQMDYIRKSMEYGKDFYLLISDSPKGIVSVCGNLIENLYVLPEEQHKGYGTKLLLFAESLCTEFPVLWVLSNNVVACSFYEKAGYKFAGNRKELKNSLAEIEMIKME